MKTTFAMARHLESRTGFGAPPRALQRMVGARWEALIDDRLKHLRLEAATAPPSWIDDAPPRAGERRDEGFRQEVRERAFELKRWWFAELLTTPSPMTEQLTMFWSNHFTSSVRKVKWPPFLHRQNATLRRLAATDVRSLLRAVIRDPAMILYLDNHTNHADAPNENFAREFFELFTLGEGEASESDIKGAARAFTGYRVNRATGAFRFASGAHDDGLKTVFGQSGHFDGDAIIELALAHPRSAPFLVSKLWRAFISPEPDPKQVAAWAAELRRSDWALKPLLRTMFTSSAFTAADAHGVLIKSPVELFVGALRTFEVELPEEGGMAIVRGLRRLGQDLFDPPNVKGWVGGPHWITTNTLLLRQSMLQRALDSRPFRRANRGRTLASWLGCEDGDAGDLVTFASQVLSPLAPVSRIDARSDGELIAQLLADPTYQLK